MALPIRRASELADAPPTDWVAKPYIAAGVITDIVGAAKAAGKSTLLQHMVRAILDGTPFLGEPTRKGEVLYLSEEKDSTLKPALERAGLLRPDLYILQWSQIWSKPWPETARELRATVKELKVSLVIVDTFAQFAPEAEAEAETGLAALRPLQLLANDGVAVVLVRHERKAGGSVGKAGRGTTAIPGGVDIMLHLRRRSGRASPVRVLSALSRFPETPEETLIELTDKGYIKKDKAGDELNAARDKLLTHISQLTDSLAHASPEDQRVQTHAKLTSAALAKDSGIARLLCQKALESLVKDGSLSVNGDGKKGSPKIYCPRKKVLDDTPKEAIVSFTN